MKVTPDSNVLLRAITEDDPRQSTAAQKSLRNAELVGLTLPALCEFVWVLERGYKIPAHEIGETIRRLIDTDNVVTNRGAVEAGLQMLGEGGDFADGVIAHEGRWFGCDTFLSFDKRAVKILAATGRKTQVPA
ncbi:MAG: type II toxin-antitoxin system VapC family toxin [Proteobacteria bacterium]|nr:type II toxin-antitoxin system VapC family toxin [Pseudomonadota bacterium]